MQTQYLIRQEAPQVPPYDAASMAQGLSAQLAQWQQAGQEGLVLWDESSWEKPESRQLEDLGPTRSSKAARLTHSKAGYYTPPGRPIFVPGMQWLAVRLVAQRWWTTRGPHASFKRDEEGKRLVELAATWGHAVIHVFDQGFASGISARAAAGLRLLAHLTQGARSPAAPLAAALLRSSHRRPLSNSQAATHPVALRLESLVARLASQLRLVGFCAHAHLRERSQLASRSTAKRKVSELLGVEVWLASLWGVFPRYKKHDSLFLFLQHSLLS